MKILHSGDHHLGMKFSTHQKNQRELVEARFESLERILKVADDESCDYWLIAGDLFDRLTVTLAERRRTIETLSRFSGKAVFVLPGNHDYDAGLQDQLWKQCSEWAGDRVVILRSASPVSLAAYEGKGTLLPAPCHSKHGATPATQWIYTHSFDSSLSPPYIALAHGSLEGVSFDKQGNYFPMKKSDLLAVKPISLWCLGHVHSPFPLTGMDSRIFYSGTPEPDGWDCKHGGGVWIHQWSEEAQRFNSRWVETGQYRFIDEEIHFSDFKSLEAAYQNLLKSLDLASKPKNQILLRLELVGGLSRDELNDFEVWKSQRGQEFSQFRLEVSQLRTNVSWQEVEAQYDPGSFPYELLKQLKEEDPKTLQLAYDTLLSATNDSKALGRNL